MDILFLISIFRLYLGLKLSIDHNSARKNLFLSASFWWDSRISAHEMDQKFKIGRTIGYGDSNLEFIFRHFKVFRLHAILHDAARAVRAHIGKGPDYCYSIGRGRNSCLLGDVTGLFFCLYVNFFLASIFNPVDFWSIVSCLEQAIEQAEKLIWRDLGVFINGNVQEYSLRLPEKYKPIKSAVSRRRILKRIVWNSGRLDYSELPNILPREEKGENFAKGTEKCKILGNLTDKKSWKIWDITAVPNIKISLMKKFGFARVAHLNARPHFTGQSVRQDCLVTD